MRRARIAGSAAVAALLALAGYPCSLNAAVLGSDVEAADPEFDLLVRDFPGPPDRHGARSIIVVDVHRVSDSCGYSVPLMSYEGDRDLLIRAHERRSDEDLAQYRQTKNGYSIDGRPVFATDDART